MQIALLALMIIGILVMFRFIPLNKVANWIIGVILIVVFAPVVLATLQTQKNNFTYQNHPLWVYILAFFIVLMIIRLILNFLFQKK